ncbi:hypothetical protein RND81_01G061100 [Saponaria officinalis]|uniref:Root cap n=1 Tax=Saponaria officinalis TaxID=3572 RepID=A0AAW1NCV5_SAPOF
MKCTMVVTILLIVAISLLAEADDHDYPKGPKDDKLYPKTKKVKCKDKYSPCYKEDLYCPESCPKSCWVDCNSCQPICDAVYTPPSPVYTPPPPVYTPPPPPSTPTTPYPPPSPTPSPPSPSPPTTPYPPHSPPAVTPSPPASAVNPKHARCKNKNYPDCYFRQFTCPEGCADSCQVDCVTCRPVCDCNKPGAVCQDPRFVGADGLTFYFHGIKDQDFCLVSDPNLHINAHFIGKRNANMGRDFTWVQSLGILFNTHKLYIGARKTATWNDALDRLTLSFDGQPIELHESEGATWESSNDNDGLRVTRSKATNAVEIVLKNKFKIKAVVVPITEKDSMIHKYGITQEDCFAHLDLSFKFYSLSGEVNGVLGQTYASNYVSRVKVGNGMSVLGGEREFHSSSLFATDCAVARFNGNEGSSEEIDFADLNCASGISGRGVVCKR